MTKIYNNPEQLMKDNYSGAEIEGPHQWGICTGSNESLTGAEYEVWSYQYGSHDSETVALVNDPEMGWREADGGEIGEGWDW